MATATIRFRGSLLRPLHPAVILLALYPVGLVINLVLDGRLGNLLIAAGTMAATLTLVLSIVAQRGLTLDNRGLNLDGGGPRWSDVGLIWVEWSGPSWLPQRLRSPVMWVWSAEQIAYTRRTGFPPMRLVRLTLAFDRTPEQLADLVRAVAPATVEIGSGPDREEFIAQLRRRATRTPGA